MNDNIKISIVLPSRGRPERLSQLLESILSTSDDLSRIEVVVLLDDDDEMNYTRRTFGELNCHFFLGQPGRTMGQLNQECVSRANGEVIFFSNDDVIFRTSSWDTRLLREVSAQPSSIYLMYPNDIFKGPKLCTFPILNRELLLKYPEILPRQYLGAFMDLHIMDIFKAYYSGSSIKYLDKIVCEHVHYRTNTALLDTTYTQRDRFGDDGHFIELATERARIVSQLSGNIFKRQHCFKKNSVFQLLCGSASLRWKVKLFSYMLTRRAYKLIFRT